MRKRIDGINEMCEHKYKNKKGTNELFVAFN